MKYLIIYFFALFLSGCSLLLVTDWEDVSNEPEFKSLVGTQYTSKTGLNIHGITMEPNYEKILNHYALMNFGIAGPEVLSAEILPLGTRYIIAKIVRCVDCIVKFEKVKFKVLSTNKFNDAPIYFDYHQFLKTKDKIFN